MHSTIMVKVQKESTSDSSSLEMEFRVTKVLDTEMEICHKALPCRAFPIMNQLRNEGRFCDVQLKVGEEILYAHRVVLAATIPYFYSMFTLEMKEATLFEITLNEVDADALKTLVDFAYTGSLIVNIDNVQRIMLVASFLQLNSIRDGCASFLRERVTPENVIGIKTFVEALNCSYLVSYADRFIQNNFKRVSQSEEFLQLGITDILHILGYDELQIDSEEDVYLAMIRWVKEDSEFRSMDLPRLLRSIRMPLISPQFLTDIIASDPLIKTSLECRDLLDEARSYFLLPERRKTFTTFKTIPRTNDKILGYIYVVGGLTKLGDSVSTVEVYDPLMKKWTMAEAMKMLRSRVGVAVIKGRLYAVGGFNGFERLETCEVFDPNAKVWSKVSSMTFRRSAVGCCALNNRIYVCGGYDGQASLNNVECYEPERDQWTMVPSMINHRSAAGVVALQNKIYAIGGHDGLSIFNSVEVFDHQDGTWTYAAPMKTNRCRLGAAALGGKVYCCGGYDGSSFLATLEVYDPETNEWTELAPMAHMRSRVVLVSNGGRLFAIGGYDGVSNLSSVEMYDPVKNTWELIPGMCAHEGGVGAAIMPMETGDSLIS